MISSFVLLRERLFSWQGPHLLPVGCLVIVVYHAYYCYVVCNLMIELEVCAATQSWVNREYRRGLSTHPCGAPVLRISVVEIAVSYLHHLGVARQEV
jgi:hypothetical protein